MADDDFLDPASGVPMTLPDAPGNFGETVIRKPDATKDPIAYDDFGNPLVTQAADPFTPLTPQQENEERARLNMRAGLRGSLAGSSSVARAKGQAQLPTPGPDVPQEVIDAAGGFPFEHEGKTYIPPEEKKRSDDYLEDVQADILAYNNMRPFSGFTEGAAALGGQFLGGMASPENLIFPELKIGTAAWYATHPVMGSIIAQGFGQAAVNAVTDPLVQANQVKAALKKEYEPADTLIAIPTGFVFGAGIPATYHTLSGLFKRGVEGLASRLGRNGPALAPEIKPPAEPEAPAINLDQQGGPKQPMATVDKSGTPTGITRPEPPVQDGFTRVYKTDKPGTVDGEHVTFTFKPEETATSYLDVPDATVPTRSGDSISLPNEIARQRQPLPTQSVPEAVADRVARARAAEARASEKITAEPDPEVGKSFTEFVREQGGLKPSPEIDAIYGRKRPDIIRNDGKTLDQMREAAVEAKYFRDQGIESGGTATSSINDVLSRLDDEARGVQHYPEGKGPPRKADAKMAEVESEVYAHMQEMGHEPTAKENRKAFRDAANMVYRDGFSPEDAVERALMREGNSRRASLHQPEELPFDVETRQKTTAAGSDAPKSPEEMRREGFIGPMRPGETEVVNLNAAMRSIANALGIDIRSGVKAKGALGTLQGKLMRLVELGPDGYITFAHEMGHFVEQQIGRPMTALITKFSNSMKAFAGPLVEGDPAHITKEGFGEFMAQYMSEREAAIRKDPNFVREFENLLQKTEQGRALKDQLDRGYNAYQAYQNAPSTQIATSMITTRTGIKTLGQADPLRRNPVMQMFANFYRKVVDKQAPLNAVVNNLLRDFEKRTGTKYDLVPEKDPRSLFQILRGGSHSKTMAEMSAGLLDNNFQHSGAAIVETMRKVALDPVTGAPPPDIPTMASRKRDFAAYLTAVWHQELRMQMRRGEIELSRPPTGMTDNTAATTIASMEAKYPAFKALAEEVYAYNKGLVKKEVDAGLRDIDSYQEFMHERNHKYVPLHRDMSSPTGGKQMGGAKDMAGLEDLGRRQRTGSSRNIIDPIDSLMERHFSINEQASYNRGVMALRDFVRSIGGAEGVRFVEEIPNHQMRINDIDVRRVIERGLVESGHTAGDARDIATMHLMELNLESKVRLFQQTEIEGKGRPIIFGMEGGKRIALQLPDGEFGQHLMTAIDFMGTGGVESVSRAAGILHSLIVKPSRALRFGAVTTLTFAVKNLIRDAFGSFLYINGVKVPGETFFRGARHLIKEAFGGESELMSRYRETGGLEGGSMTTAYSQEGRFRGSKQALYGWDVSTLIERTERDMARRAAGEDVGVFKRGLETVRDYGKVFSDSLRLVAKAAEFSELANRVGIFEVVYNRNLRQHRSEEFAMIDAAQKARDFVDFGRHGSRTELLGQAVPFLNANIQGFDKFARTLADVAPILGERRALTAKDAAELTGKRLQLLWRVGTLAAVSVYLETLYSDDPWYQNLPAQRRATSWNFKVMGQEVSIPKPFEYGSLLNLAENAVRYANTGDAQHMLNWVKSWRYTFNFPSGIPIVSTTLGLAANFDDYFDRPIVPERMQKLEPYLQRYNNTSAFYTMVAQALHAIPGNQYVHDVLKASTIGGVLASAWSPLEAQWTVSRMLGDWPREFGGILGVAKSLTSGDNVKMEDIPVLRVLLPQKVTMGESTRELINQTNQHDGRLTRTLATYMQFQQNGDKVGAQQYFDNLDRSQKEYVTLNLMERPGALVTNMHPMNRAKQIYTAIARINNQIGSDTGLRSYNDPSRQVPVAENMKTEVINLLAQYSANQARNALIMQNAPGYRGQVTVPTQPDLDKLKVMAPEVHKELVTELAARKVLSTPAVEKYWPQMQKLIEGGGNAKVLGIQAHAIGVQAGAAGLEGGGIALNRGAIVEGERAKKGSAKPKDIPAFEGVRP